MLITLASKNTGKLNELTHWLQQSHAGLPVELAVNPDAPEVEETGEDFVANAVLKASQSTPLAGSKFILGEDSGLSIDALDGLYDLSPFPGLKSNRWLSAELRMKLLDVPPNHPVVNQDLCEGILKLMKGEEDRGAAYCCGMALYHVDKGLLFSTLEQTPLRITEGRMRGKNGFGYDFITEPIIDGQPLGKLTSEMETDEKNVISHRGKAFRKVLEFIESLPEADRQ